MPTENLGSAPSKKETAPRSRSTAVIDSIAESRITEEIQPPSKSGHRLYQLKPNCPGFSTTDWIRLRRWQRMKDHERWIYDFMVKARERTFFVTVTFIRLVSDKQAKEVGRRFLQKRLKRIVEAYVRVIERQKNGRAHIHFVFRVITSATACGWKLIWLALQWHGASYGFGRYEIESVRSPKKLAWYLVKSFREGALRATGKVVTYANNVRRVKYATDSLRWERAVGRFAEELGCATKQELTKKLGIGWPFRYRLQIYSIGARA